MVKAHARSICALPCPKLRAAQATAHRPPSTDNRQPTTDLCPLKFENNPADLTIKVFQLILPS